MGMRTVRLSFRGPVHFGNGRLSDGKLACDAATLFSALYIEALHTGGAERLLSAAQDGALVLSDAFPYVGNDLYLPKPMVKPGTFGGAKSATGATESQERKASKKLGYVRASQYANFLKGNFDPIGELERFEPGVSYLQTKVNLTRATSDDAEPYHVGGFKFTPGAGLYFLVDAPFDLSPLLEQLSYSGLGGKRTSGYGQFDFEMSDAGALGRMVSAGAEGGPGVLLSTAAPMKAELADEVLAGARYRLVRRGGFVQSTMHAQTPQKKRDLYLFAAGSMFERRFAGGMFDVNDTPGAHPVYRYARALWMGV